MDLIVGATFSLRHALLHSAVCTHSTANLLSSSSCMGGVFRELRKCCTDLLLGRASDAGLSDLSALVGASEIAYHSHIVRHHRQVVLIAEPA